MKTNYLRSNSKPAQQAADARPDRLDRLAGELGVSVDTVRTFSKISDPAHGSRFSAAAARKAFAHVKIKR